MKQKRIRRIAPCPAYDVEKIEAWLSDMAKEGWILETDGDIFGWLAFVKEAPRSVQYRLEPKEEGTGFGDVPDMEIRELCGEYGWEYVDSYGNFFIYRSIRSDFREMNTDLQVQAAALKASKRNSSITLVLDFILLSNIFGQFLHMPVWSLVHLGLGYHLAQLFALIWVSTDSFLHWRHLRKLQKQLKANIPLNHRKPWRKGAAFHIFSKFAYVLVMFLFFGLMFGSCMQRLDIAHTKTTDFPGEPPFVTAGDIFPEGEFTRESFLQDYNAYTEDSTFFAPRIIEWKEYGEIALPDGTTCEGSLLITYYEVRWPWVAKGIMKDLYRDAEKYSHFAERIPPDIPVDEAVCFNNIYPTILIRQGNILVKASISLRYQDHYLLEEWAQRMAKMLGSE